MLMKASPLPPALPFRAVKAVGTLEAPPQGRYIDYKQYNEQNDDHLHYTLLLTIPVCHS